MTYVALGLGVGGLVLGAGTSIYGASQTPDGIKQHDLPMNAYSPWADPLLSQLTLNAGTGVGQYSPQAYMQASPVQQLLAGAQMGGQLDRRQFRLMQGALNFDPDVLMKAFRCGGR